VAAYGAQQPWKTGGLREAFIRDVTRRFDEIRSLTWIRASKTAFATCAYCGSPRLPNNQSRCRVMFPDKARLRRLLPRLQTKSKLSLPSL
jgi:hypothetical protein